MLQAIGASAAELKEFPAHSSLADLKSFSSWVDAFHRKRNRCRRDSGTLLAVQVAAAVPQHILHELVGALYRSALLFITKPRYARVRIT